MIRVSQNGSKPKNLLERSIYDHFHSNFFQSFAKTVLTNELKPTIHNFPKFIQKLKDNMQQKSDLHKLIEANNKSKKSDVCISFSELLNKVAKKNGKTLVIQKISVCFKHSKGTKTITIKNSRICSPRSSL